MIRSIFIALLFFFVSQSYASQLVIGQWTVVFLNSKDVPIKVSETIDKYKNELKLATKITSFKEGLENAILAQGYFDVEISIKDTSLIVNLGPLYKLAKINYFRGGVLVKNDEPLSSASSILAENIEFTKKIYLNSSAKENCIFNYQGDVRVDLDKKNKFFTVNYYISGIENAKFGYIKIHNTGNKIAKEFIERELTFQEDQCYKFNRVDNSKINLYKTEVFSEVKIEQTQRDSTKYIDIDIETDIKNSKKIESTVEFSSEDKIAGGLSFNNKNFRSKGEKLNFFTKISKKNKETKLEHKSADGLIENIVKYEVKTSDLQKERLAEYVVNKTYKINNKNTIIAGLSIKNSNLLFDNNSKNEKSTIYSVPLLYELKLKKNDDNYTNHAVILDFLTSQKNSFFYKTGYKFQKYFKLFSKKKFFVSFDAAISKLNGKNTPLTEHTYLGGVNSIRGYKNETVGFFENNKNVPATGYYFLKSELSYRFDNNWATGVFYDLGRLSNERILKVNNIVDSIGLSLKYYINELPISFDLALPLKKKYSGKSKYEFYLNMGFNL